MFQTPTPHISRQARRLRQDRADARRPPALQVHCGAFSGKPRAGEQCPWRSGLHRHLQGREGQRHGLRHGYAAIGIYSHELFNGYGVENIIRVGSAGSIQEHIHLYDLVLAQGACTDSNFAAQFHLPGTFAPIASFELLSAAVESAKEQKATYHVGNVNSSDVFYGDHEGVPEGLDSEYGLKKMGVMALEMESAALYMNAARYGKRALCICTISDHVLTGEETTSEERQTAFTTMMKVALETAVKMEGK